MKKTDIVFAGEGGQGIQTIAKVLAKAAINQGFDATYLPSFGVEQRGTPSVAYVSISSDKIRYSKFENADILVVLQKRAIPAIDKYIAPHTKVVFDSSTIEKSDLPLRSMTVLGVPATKYAFEKFSPKTFNILVLGFLCQLTGLDKKSVWEEVLNEIGKKFKTMEIKKNNEDAFKFGFDLVFEKDDFTKASFRAKHKSILYKGYGKHGEIVPSRCKGCGICIFKCPVGALSWSQDLGVYANPIPMVDLEKCIACGNCRNFCPDSAIGFEKDK